MAPAALRASCAAGVAALMMVGCQSMAPTYERPPLPVAAEYPSDAPAGAAATRASEPDIGWRDYFSDPELRAMVEQALQNNRDLRTAILQVAEARARYGIQRADRFPDVAVGADGSRSRTPGALSPTGRPLVATSYEVNLGLSTWELDFWGRVRSLELAALESYLAADAARRAFSVSLAAEVANAWLIVRELDQRIDLARRSIASREESFRIFSRRHEIGSSSRLELMQVEGLLTQAQALGAELEQQRAVAGHALSLLVGAPVRLEPRTGVLDGQGGLYPLQPGLPSDLLVHRPDIVAAEHRLIAAHADIGAARAAFFPRISLTGAVGSASGELDGLFAAGSRAWRFMPALSLPIFTGGRLQASLELAEVRRDLAVADYERTIQAAFRDVADALSARLWLERQLSIRRIALATQRERARLAQLRYDSGAVTYLEVLDAQRELLLAEQEVVQVQRRLLASQVDLFAALGGGPSGRGDGARAVSNRNP